MVLFCDALEQVKLLQFHVPTNIVNEGKRESAVYDEMYLESEYNKHGLRYIEDSKSNNYSMLNCPTSSFQPPILCLFLPPARLLVTSCGEAEPDTRQIWLQTSTSHRLA